MMMMMMCVCVCVCARARAIYRRVRYVVFPQLDRCFTDKDTQRNIVYEY